MLNSEYMQKGNKKILFIIFYFHAKSKNENISFFFITISKFFSVLFPMLISQKYDLYVVIGHLTGYSKNVRLFLKYLFPRLRERMHHT